jgi:hypothetical protein
MASGNEQESDYDYSEEEEEDYILEDDDDVMEWNNPSDNPNAAPLAGKCTGYSFLRRLWYQLYTTSTIQDTLHSHSFPHPFPTPYSMIIVVHFTLLSSYQEEPRMAFASSPRKSSFLK